MGKQKNRAAGGALATLSDAQHALALVESPTEAKELYDKLETLSQYARRAKPVPQDGEPLSEYVERVRVHTNAQNEIAETKLLTARKGGELLRDDPEIGPGKGSTLEPLGLSKATSSRWQGLARIPKPEFLAEIRLLCDEGEEVTFAAFLDRRHVENNSGENEWYTPSEYVEAARMVMGGIDLDPASSEDANEVIQAERFYCIADNGLLQEWAGRVWMNPPYARPLIDGFCGKLAESYADGDVTEACVLVNNATETGWFHALAEVASAFCFPRHRVRFWQPDEETATGLQGQAVVYLGEHVEAFRNEFLRFGFSVVR